MAAQSPLRVLVVDDDVQVRGTIVDMLTAQGASVQAAGLPGEALELAEQASEPFHLLVADVILPQMTGLELARRLAAHWPELRVVYTSGYANASIMTPDAVVPGAAFLTKPFMSSQLVSAAELALTAA